MDDIEKLRRMREVLVDCLMEATEEELREAWGDEEFEDLARRGRLAVERALAEVDSNRRGIRCAR